MIFLLQKEKTEEEDLDVRILREQLDKEKYVHGYMHLALEGINKNISKDIIPVGTLEFVGKFLKEIHGINSMRPIEVPPVLRKDVFLGRRYDIVPFNELPDSGIFFIKNASRLKDFANVALRDLATFRNKLDIDCLYQISDIIDIMAEYRVFVHRDKIAAINFYNGNPEYLPDIAIIRQMVGTYIQDNTRPKAYTLDVAITKNSMVLLEVHPWVSVGLYSYLWGSDLPYAYADGFKWYLGNRD